MTTPAQRRRGILWLDGIVVKVHHGKQVVNKSAHVVLGVNLAGQKVRKQ
jgi:transposase-like protein